ncbi:aryl hydrocarbon receptor-like isoform X1 [Nerophis lumbriciformis]|uniref:aryl hydrocarbon receptor-like isoform X1 n=2 Tax=Nerophis lumbriciformis TaxID=546530 RepID=UPI002AE02E39|nr:aryl hydrocarbon receptor-like isoform X1 [Nerophis lumbriciformis]
MLASTTLYAAKKRKKPQQKIPKLPPALGAKSNPSKRHRDRLNDELEKLTSLLPFTKEVRARLDKLSVLRLSVAYLKVKSFFNATLKNGPTRSSWHSHPSLMVEEEVQSTSTPTTALVTSIDGIRFSEGDLLLQALNSFVLVVTSEGYVFYTSPTIQDFLGFHQSDVIHQSVFELIHADDRALFRQELHFAFNPHSSQPDGTTEASSEQSSSEVTANLMTYDPQAIPPENSSFLERNFCCRFRCLLDNSSGFLALNFHGRLKLLHGQNHKVMSENGTQVPPQLALFAIATPLQLPTILEIRSKTLIFQSKHTLDFSPIGIDTRGTVVLGYSDAELRMTVSGYSFIHAADMMYCADNHLTMMKTGQAKSAFRLLTKKRKWIWVEANARLVLKGGKPDFIVVQQRPISNEEGEENLRLRRLELSFSFATGEALLYDLAPTLDMPDPCSVPKQRKLDQHSVRATSILGCMLNQDQSIYCKHNFANNVNYINDIAFQDTHATVSVAGDVWQHTSPKPSIESLVKSESTVQDMMETLQEILGDGHLIDTVNVKPEELKSWESTVLKVKSNSCEMSANLNELISEDILLYVEEQLQKEGGLMLPDQLNDVSPMLNFQNQGPADPNMGQNVSWLLDPQSQLSSGGQMMPEQPCTVLGTSLSGLNSPVMGQILSKQKLSLPTCLQDSTGGLPPSFVPSLGASFAETPMTLRTIEASFKDSNILSLRQPNHLTNQMAQPMQNCHQRMVPNLPADHCDQIQPAISFHNTQWSFNHADAFVESHTQNLPNGPVKATSCMQSHIDHPVHGGQYQRHSWQQQHQLEPQQISNGQMSLNQLSGFQTNPGFAVIQNTALSGPTFRNPFSTVEHGVGLAPIAVPSSCMLINNPPTLPVNGGHASEMLSYQKLKHVSNHIPDSNSCFNQGEGESLSRPDMATLPCQIAPGVDLGIPLMQQQYLNFSDQLNNHSVVENRGGAFPHCQTGTSASQRKNRKQL